jgi:mono/diheme cytochrome c family protein
VAVTFPGPATAKPNACKRSCRVLKSNCIAFARDALVTTRAACTGRACRHTATVAFKGDVKTCKADTRSKCRTCCPLGSLNGCPLSAGVALPAEPQVTGDPVNGRQLLLNGDYMTCGIPYKLWSTFPRIIANGYGGAADAPRISDRDGVNADLPYFLNAFTAPDGAHVVNANCLMCHGGTFDGQLVVGLGNATADFTAGAGGAAASVPLTDEGLDAFGLDATEKVQMRKIAGRGSTLGPDTHMRTIGMNPAEMFAVILMVHHDRETLAWSDTPYTPYVIKDHDGNVIEDPLVTSDPPPWWRAHKKNALFYNGMARGDHRGTMALATSVCVDDVARAQQVDEMFKDIQAFVDSVRAPAYTRPIDTVLAAQGSTLFLQNCAGCHGTYGAREEDDTYPNLLIPLDVIDTDPVVAEAGVVHAPQLVTWYNDSFYGQITRMVPNDPFPGYMPPPLDGIWATAPFLHNGSVPTVELVLNSRARPRYWKRVDLDSSHFDADALGWPYELVEDPQVLSAADRKLVYDSTFWSQSNAGHTFGDHLTADERRAVIEYLKTL